MSGDFLAGFWIRVFPTVSSISDHISSRERDLVFHIHGIPTLLTYALSLKFRRNVVIMQDHGGGRLLSPIWYFFGRIALRYCDQIFVLSPLTRDFYTQHLGYPATRIKIQTMGVDLNVFRPLAKDRCRDFLVFQRTLF